MSGMAGAGGTAGSGGAAACDPAVYGAGKACQAGDRCQDGTTVWHCTDGAFEPLVRVADSLPAGCQPLGTWSLAAGEPTVEIPFQGCGTEKAQLPTSVRLVADADGGVLSSEAGQLDTAACKLGLSHSEPHKNPSENWSYSYTVSITFEASGASGDYTRSNTGYCVGSEKGALTVTKVE